MVDLSRSAWYAPPLEWTVRDAELIAALTRLVEDKPMRGFGKCCQLLGKTHPPVTASASIGCTAP